MAETGPLLDMVSGMRTGADEKKDIQTEGELLIISDVVT